MTNSLIDAILDRTVVIGYTNIGYRIRSREWAGQDLPRMDGKVVLITGASSGLGRAAAVGFARLGATVWLLVRSRQRGETARATIVRETASNRIHLALCDLGKLDSVRQFAQRFRSQTRLDVLVNNAGVLMQERVLSDDGIELTFATNVIGPFLLTNMLIPQLARSVPARIINVSSGGMYTQRLRLDDLQRERGQSDGPTGQFDGPAVYARTKRAQVILTEIWAQQLTGRGVVAHAMHPGWVDTPGLRASVPRFYKATRSVLRTPAQGADTIVWLGAADEADRSSGRFWHDRRQRPTYLLPRTKETSHERDELWSCCVQLSGWQDEPLN
jgi:NAD(P)-dependent dehydrogenase (short-subunit alcohol dehydrogenase family)